MRLLKYDKLMKSKGFTKLNPKDHFYPVGGPDGPGTAIYQKDKEQIGVYKDGSWDHTLDEDGKTVFDGVSLLDLEKHLQ